ncbi:MAG: hypothetical protein H7Z43_13390 [Clostridia bacterium]|nr:hypothetical protein [Deltaproteobacteria bacterium]
MILSGDLTEYFRTEVTSARDELGMELEELIEFYVVRLLCDYSRPETAPSNGNEALALMYKRALEAPIGERVQILKNLGDAALYVSGFFVEFIERQLVDLDYYIAMGGTAYGSLSELIGGQRNGETFGELYAKMAEKFTELVDLLNEVASKGAKADALSDQQLLRMYDRWTRTGNVRIQRKLADVGLFPVGRKPKDFNQ